jgi:peptidoglycan/xylan/chitin deacetylase (PgdA/CDA1 family)
VLFQNSLNHVLLFHSVSNRLPEGLEKNNHNITPDDFRKIIEWYQKHFQIVFVDEIFEKPTRKGLCAITFDDGYRSVFDNAIPILQSLGVPSTVYLNGSTFFGKTQWRDKIRYMISNELVEDFIQANLEFCKTFSISLENFYKRTKSAEVPSHLLVDLIDCYLKKRKRNTLVTNYCVDKIENLITCPLVQYGNHSFNHYVLSSLDPVQQECEIIQNAKFLKNTGLKCSDLLSVPIGGISDINAATLEICRSAGYKGLLLSRNRLVNLQSTSFDHKHTTKVPMIDRFQAGNTALETYLKLPKLVAKAFYHKKKLKI